MNIGIIAKKQMPKPHYHLNQAASQSERPFKIINIYQITGINEITIVIRPKLFTTDPKYFKKSKYFKKFSQLANQFRSYSF